MTRHPVARLEDKERAGIRPAGYAAAVIAAGRVVKDDTHGDYVELTPEAWLPLRARYAPSRRLAASPPVIPPGYVQRCLKTLGAESARRTVVLVDGEPVTFAAAYLSDPALRRDPVIGFLLPAARYAELQRQHPPL